MKIMSFLFFFLMNINGKSNKNIMVENFMCLSDKFENYNYNQKRL